MAKHLIGCTLWSLALPDTVRSLEKAAEIGFEAVQFTFRQPSDMAPAGLARLREAIRRTGLKVPSGCVIFADEDYSSIAAIRKTGGFVVPELYDQRLELCRRWGQAQADLGLRHTAAHAGFIPEPHQPGYVAALDRIGACVDALHDAGLTVSLETGQESADVLKKVLDDLGRDFVGVNFDAANFILYGSDDPVRAARVLAGRVSGIHIKDGRRSPKPGEVWGEDVPAGTGQVDFPAVLRPLFQGGFTGALIIEREAGNDRAGDLAAGRRFLEGVLKNLGS